MSIHGLRQLLVGSATLFLLFVATGLAQTPGTGAIAGTIYSGTSEIQRVVIGRMLGL